MSYRVEIAKMARTNVKEQVKLEEESKASVYSRLTPKDLMTPASREMKQRRPSKFGKTKKHVTIEVNDESDDVDSEFSKLPQTQSNPFIGRPKLCMSP